MDASSYDQWRLGSPSEDFDCERCEMRRGVEEYNEDHEVCENCAEDIEANSQ